MNIWKYLFLVLFIMIVNTKSDIQVFLFAKTIVEITLPNGTYIQSKKKGYSNDFWLEKLHESCLRENNFNKEEDSTVIAFPLLKLMIVNTKSNPLIKFIDGRKNRLIILNNPKRFHTRIEIRLCIILLNLVIKLLKNGSKGFRKRLYCTFWGCYYETKLYWTFMHFEQPIHMGKTFVFFYRSDIKLSL